MTSLFAQDLRLARRKAGHTQGDIAHLLDTHQSTISDLEHGQLRPTLEQIIDLSLIYGRSFESLFSEIMAERRTHLTNRLARLPSPARDTVHTYNRTSSLSRLARRLKQSHEHESA